MPVGTAQKSRGVKPQVTRSRKIANFAGKQSFWSRQWSAGQEAGSHMVCSPTTPLVLQTAARKQKVLRGWTPAYMLSPCTLHASVLNLQALGRCLPRSSIPQTRDDAHLRAPHVLELSSRFPGETTSAEPLKNLGWLPLLKSHPRQTRLSSLGCHSPSTLPSETPPCRCSPRPLFSMDPRHAFGHRISPSSIAAPPIHHLEIAQCHRREM